MARPVIKAFIDKTRGGRLYAPASRQFNTYEGEREEELFEKGYLGEKESGEVEETSEITSEEIESGQIDADEAEEQTSTETESLNDFTKDELKALLDEKGIEYPKSALKDDLVELLNQE